MNEDNPTENSSCLFSDCHTREPAASLRFGQHTKAGWRGEFIEGSKPANQECFGSSLWVEAVDTKRLRVGGLEAGRLAWFISECSIYLSLVRPELEEGQKVQNLSESLFKDDEWKGCRMDSWASLGLFAFSYVVGLWCVYSASGWKIWSKCKAYWVSKVQFLETFQKIWELRPSIYVENKIHLDWLWAW